MDYQVQELDSLSFMAENIFLEIYIVYERLP
jgi:hypothetical protein